MPDKHNDVRARMRAAELTLQRPVVPCLQTAAQVYRLDVDADADLHVLAEHDWSNATAGIHQHRYTPVAPHTLVGGCRVTDLAETVVRVACAEKDPAKVLAVLDSALFRTSIQKLELSCMADRLHIRQIGLVRELIPLADGRAESPGESWLRWVCIEGGLPTPEPQIWVVDEFGERYRVDLGWAERRVGCEYEGEEFHTKGALTKDRHKYNALGRQGWLMHGVTSPMIWTSRRRLVANVQSLLDQRAV